MFSFPRMSSVALLGLALSLPQLVHAKEFELRSGPHRTALVELYTSEGCSSCPPADRWVSQLIEDQRLWKTIVPIAFHVDYWDYIGWKDEFAEAKFGTRQRVYRRRGLISSVYTPGFIVAGQEWRGWFSHPHLKLPPAPDPGALEASGKDGKVTIRYTPTPSGNVPQPTVHVAVLGFNLSTEVKAGENDGRKLYHNFVVLGHKQHPLKAENGQLKARFSLPEVKVDAPRKALAVWVSHRDDPRPVQALGGWL